MYELFIMDDVPDAAAVTRAAVEASPLANRFAVTIVSSERELASSLSTGHVPDVLLADINMGNRAPTGIEIVQHLFFGEGRTQVIYVTGFVEFCTAVYETNHIYFLTKPLHQNELNRALLRAVQKLEGVKRYSLVLQFGGNVAAVPFADILYLESRRRKIEVHTEHEFFEAYATMADALVQLPEEFFQCHKSYIVNFEHVVKFDNDGLTLRNGERVPVSQRRRQDTRDSFFRYLGKA